MLMSLLFGLVAVGYLGLFSFIVRKTKPLKLRHFILCLVILSLVYDNAILAIGNIVGVPHSGIEMFSHPRFWMHIFFVPLFCIWALLVAQSLDLRWSKQYIAIIGIVILTLALMIIELIQRWPVAIVPATDKGLQRYTSAGSHAPIGVIVSVILVVLLGIVMWRRFNWRWLAVAGITTFMLQAVGEPVGILILSAVAELIFVAGLVVTEGWLSKHEFNQTALA